MCMYVDRKEDERTPWCLYVSSDSPILLRREGTFYGCCTSGLQIIPSLFDVAFHAQVAQLYMLTHGTPASGNLGLSAACHSQNPFPELSEPKYTYDTCFTSQSSWQYKRHMSSIC